MKRKIKLDWRALFLLLGPIFYFVPLMVHELFVGVSGDYGMIGKTVHWLVMGLFFSTISLVFLPNYWLNPHNKTRKWIKGLIILLSMSPILFVFLMLAL
jgi:hypothetical protein